MDIIEGHPIPQDITGFQFRIIGNLTIKQFAYLAAGLVIAWIIFVFPLPLFIKVPVAGFFAGTGIIFAFVPIQGRPADSMLLLFFRAVMRPNEYTYDKHQPSAHANNTSPHHSLPTPPTVVQATMPLSPAPEPLAEQPTVTQQPNQEKKEETSDQLSQVLEEKKRLEQQLEALQQQLQQKQSTTAQPVTSSEPTVKEPLPDDATSTPIQRTPDAPNVLLGTVKDARGNPLPNILIEVKDKEDNPVRAFKTSPQGTFASATPLLNGAYKVVFEDPKKQQQFAEVTIHATGEIMPPLDVISVDERENLRKSLFGG